MPYLMIRTNQPVDAVDTLLARFSAAVAEMLGKPEQYVMVTIEPDKPLLFGGSAAAAVYLELKSINLPAERTTDFSAQLAELVQREMGIPQERVYVEFANAERHMWGWNGRTF